MTNEEKIIWKKYPEFPFIEANQFGEVRTVDRYVTVKGRGKRLIKGRILKQHKNNMGYMYVGVGLNGKNIKLLVHRIVAASHLPNPNNLPEVNHIDCDPTNNRADNLEWCTHQENTAYRDRLGRTAKHNGPKKPVIAVNPDTFEVFWFETRNEAACQLGVDSSTVTKVVKGKRYRKTTGGYWFCNADENAVEKVKVRFGDEVAKKVKDLMKGD